MRTAHLLAGNRRGGVEGCLGGWAWIPARPAARRLRIVHLLYAFGLFVLTAIAEVVGCYLPYLWLRQGKSPWLLVPAVVSLAAFAWLLTLHPTGAARTYAAYGGVYIAVALVWLWLVEGERPTTWDLVGASVALLGMAIIVLGPRR
ncbi:YnfA family protein [Comamonas sp. JC664]|nr:YnfA family protein [Comamonas sp. JC664]